MRLWSMCASISVMWRVWRMLRGRGGRLRKKYVELIYPVILSRKESCNHDQTHNCSHLPISSQHPKKPNHRSNQPSDYSTTTNHLSTARPRHHPNKQRRHRRRPPPPLPTPQPDHQDPNNKPALALPHPPNLPPVPPRSPFRRHNRHNLLRAWETRRREPDGLRCCESGIDCHARFVEGGACC